MTCPACGSSMKNQTLAGHGGKTVDIDVCVSCQRFWFDGFESLQLSPGATLQLFHLVGDQAPPSPAAGGYAPPACPRCGATLLRAHDQQRTTKFEYLRCPNGHGRLITFFNFLREKDFIRPLPPEQIEALRQNIQVVRCSNCGASIDLTKTSTCEHCGTALSMVDMKQAQALVQQLQQAERADHEVDPAVSLRLIQARREVERAFESFERGSSWTEDIARGDVVGAGISAIARWLKYGR